MKVIEADFSPAKQLTIEGVLEALDENGYDQFDSIIIILEGEEERVTMGNVTVAEGNLILDRAKQGMIGVDECSQ